VSKDDPVDPLKPERPAGYVELTLQLARPKTKELAKIDRGQKYKYLRAQGEERRTRLIEWLEAQGLADEVFRVGEATAFDLLFVEATPRVARQLVNAPGVLQVTASVPLELDVEEPGRKGEE
jgi:hypothetical protein